MSQFTYAIVRTDGTHKLVECDEINLEGLQSLVGGDIQALSFDGACGYINESGKVVGLPVNEVATSLAHQHQSIFVWDTINGDMVIVGPVDSEGEDTPLSVDWYNEQIACVSFR